MKTILFFLLITLMAGASGCSESGGGNQSGPDNRKAVTHSENNPLSQDYEDQGEQAVQGAVR